MTDTQYREDDFPHNFLQIEQAKQEWESKVERKRIERALQSREQEYHRLVDQLAAAVAILRQQRLVFVNQAFVTMFDYSREDLHEMNPVDLFCRHDRDIVSTRLTRFPPPAISLTTSRCSGS